MPNQHRTTVGGARVHAIRPLARVRTTDRRHGPGWGAILLWLTLGLITLSQCACSPSAGPAASAPADPIYSVSALRAAVGQDAQPWIGRIVRVRAIAEPCAGWGSPSNPLRCTAVQPDLIDRNSADLAGPLPLTIGPGHSLLSLLRRLPLAGRLMPPPAQPPWETLATYRVRLALAPAYSCGQQSCFGAVLLDTAPASS